MKIVKLSFVIAVAVAFIFGLCTVSFAFHSGGVAECTGCHNIHDGQDGATTNALLVGGDPSSTCLSCHANAATGSYHELTWPLPAAGVAPLNYTPGGDFAWLKKDYFFVVRNAANSDLGSTHGHNIVAGDFGFGPDTINTTAPGGTFSAGNLACNSCHDNHGRNRIMSNLTFSTGGAPIIGSGSYNTSATPAAGQAIGVYRLLRGLGDASRGVTFSANPPVAVAPGTYNVAETDSTQLRVAYGSGMSEWCATCHPDMLSGTSTKHSHPVSTDGKFTTDQINNYNAYKMSGNMTGIVASAYNSLVPFEVGGTGGQLNALVTLRTQAKALGAPDTGADSNSQVMCLSCHRAHASGFDHMTRWFNDSEFMVTNSAFAQVSRGQTAAEAQAAYYGRTVASFSSYQRSLCNKCHAKD